MDIVRCISVLVVLFVHRGESGGHGESYHDHVKLHVPEFIHHDHHTKIITIHHHHHKPKEKHHHHHHHHHHKPHVPYGHHYHKHHKKTHTKSHTSASSHGQGHHGHHGSHGHRVAHGHQGSHGHHGSQGHHSSQGHHGHHGHHGHQGNTYKHHNPPSFNYDPNPVTFEDDFKSFTPSLPPTFSQTPQVYGVEHTVKQVKVFDSLPGALPSNPGSHGYEVTEEGEQSDDDAFTDINTLPQVYPGTFGFVRNVEEHPTQNEVFADFPVQSSVKTSHNPFGGAPQPASYADVETFSTGQADPFSSLAPTNEISPSVSTSHFPGNIQVTGFDEPGNEYPGDITGTALLSTDDALYENTPVSFSREAGIQQTIKTDGVETLVY